MSMSRFTATLLVLLLVFFAPASAEDEARLQPYLDALAAKGEEPVEFVLATLATHDLVLFDDALHTAVEPFEFYERLLDDVRFRSQVKYIFLETIPVNQQPAIDAYLSAATEDQSLLYPAFQNDFSGFGWRYQTYFDLLSAVRRVNQEMPAEDRLHVLAVNAPTYWSEISSPEDVDLFRRSLAGNDYTMYTLILSYLDGFRSGKKGIFLTNTRHAYKGIRDSEGKLYWNCGTFFAQRHPEHTYSVRFHNITLKLESGRKQDSGEPKTTEGLEGKRVSWVRVEGGLWDSAFREFGDKPVAFDIQATPFGDAAYIGNHMLNVTPGQTMHDAYDGLIFLAPADSMRQTAMVDFLYTEVFMDELERRVACLYTNEQIEGALQQAGVSSKREYLDKSLSYEPETLQPLLQTVGPIDGWKRNGDE